MDVSSAVSLGAILAGACGGVRMTAIRPRASTRRLASGAGIYLVVAGTAGVVAAFMRAAAAPALTTSYHLARGLSETINCGGYGVLAGVLVGGLVMGGRALLGRQQHNVPPQFTGDCG